MIKNFIIPPQPPLNNDLIPRYFYSPDPEDEPIYTSYLGTPVYSNLIFSSDGVDVGNPTSLDPDNGKQDLRIDTVLFDVSMTKNIKVTDIQGRNGTIKEYISDGDYMINIKGAIVSPYPLVFPKEDVDLLIRYSKVSTEIKVFSFFLDLFSITDIVIKEFKLSEKLGHRNQVDFEINALSDRAIEFRLNPNKGL